jgi:hypothetical protein
MKMRVLAALCLVTAGCTGAGPAGPADDTHWLTDGLVEEGESDGIDDIARGDTSAAGAGDASFSGCVSVELTGGEHRLSQVDVDTGEVVGLHALPGVESGQVLPSIALVEDHALFCSDFGRLTRVHLESGAVEHAAVSCEAVAGWKGQLLIMPSAASGDSVGALSTLRLYATFEDIENGAQPTVITTDYWASRMTAHGDRLYLAWHSTDMLEVRALPDGAALPDVVLEGFDDWADGLAIVDDELFINSWDGIFRFDAATGEQTDFVATGAPMLMGLACR